MNALQIVDRLQNQVDKALRDVWLGEKHAWPGFRLCTREMRDMFFLRCDIEEALSVRLKNANAREDSL